MNPALPSNTSMDEINKSPSVEKLGEKFKLIGELVANDPNLTEDQKDALLKTALLKVTNTLNNEGKSRGVNTYYKEEYALQLIPDLDYLLHPDTPSTAVLFYALEDFPNWRSTQTLKMFVCNAFRYVVDHLDPEGKYAELRERTRVCRIRDGVKVIPTAPRCGPGYTLQVKARRLVDGEAGYIVNQPWEIELKNFMDTPNLPGAYFKRPDDAHPQKLSLTQEQIDRWSRVFETSETFGAVIKKHEIIVRRLKK